MKVYVKLIVVVIFATMTATLSAKQTYQNIKFRKLTNVYSANQIYAPTLDRGCRYDVVTTDLNHSNYNTTNRQSLYGPNTRYYHSYGVRKIDNMSVTYTLPCRVERNVVYNVANRTPFEDVVVTSQQRRVSEEVLPNDPSVPLGDGVIPLLFFAIAMIIYRYKKS